MTHPNSISEVIVVEDSPSMLSPKYTSLLGKDLRRTLKRRRQQESSVQLISSDEDVPPVTDEPHLKKSSKRRRRRVKMLLRSNADLGTTPGRGDFHRIYPEPYPPLKQSKKKFSRFSSMGKDDETVTSVDETTKAITVTDNVQSRKGKKRSRFDLLHNSESTDASVPNNKNSIEKISESISTSDSRNIGDNCKDNPETTEKKKRKRHKSDTNSHSNISHSKENELVCLPKNAHISSSGDDGDSNVFPSVKNPDILGSSEIAVELADESDDEANNTILSINSDGGALTTDGTKLTRPVTISNDTILLSDDEDDLRVIKTRMSTSSDIIVLGTPTVPTVTNYKGISKNRNQSIVTGSLLPCPSTIPLFRQAASTSGILPSTVTNVLMELTKIPNWMELLASQNALQSNHEDNNVPWPFSFAHPGQNSSVPDHQLAPSARPWMTEDRRPESLMSPDNKYGSNIYNPTHKSTAKHGLRPIIIDGSNVAMGHGLGKFFSSKGLEICVNYFVKRKHKVHAFLPMYRKKSFYTRDCHILHKLEQDKHLIFTPSRNVDGKNDVPYDDRYIVQAAAELGGIIVSTDNYRDLLEENQSWHDTIKNRLLMFTWVEDILMFPQDPLGKRGPKLEAFLRF